MESGERRWCGGADEAVVAMGRCVRKREAREGVWAIKPKPSRRGSISGAPSKTARGDGGEMWCGGVYEVVVVVVVVVGLCAHKTRAREGIWAKTRNRAVEARFRARRVKRRQGMVRMGGVVVCTIRWWWWGRAFAQREARSGFGLTNPKPSCRGSVSGCSGAAGGREGCCGLQPPSRAKL
jgi:hypothetical protein